MAAALSPVFGRRSPHAHCVQSLAQLGLMLSQHCSLQRELSLQLWRSVRDNKQRLQLLRCSCHLYTLAFSLPRAANRREYSRKSFETKATAFIMKRCFSRLAWQFLTDRASNRHCQNGRSNSI
jgi:hypothetical protein